MCLWLDFLDCLFPRDISLHLHSLTNLNTDPQPFSLVSLLIYFHFPIHISPPHTHIHTFQFLTCCMCRLTERRKCVNVTACATRVINVIVVEEAGFLKSASLRSVCIHVLFCIPIDIFYAWDHNMVCYNFQWFGCWWLANIISLHVSSSFFFFYQFNYIILKLDASPKTFFSF